ncbi:MAG TPA: hypothetical protein VGC49_11270 [Solirubrobacterales bacterium]|jgi:hypothetical protein
MESDHPQTRRVRVEQGIYLQPNGKYAVCFMAAGRPRFRTVGYDIEEARAERILFVESIRAGVPLATPELRFARVAGWWIERYERRVEAASAVSARSRATIITWKGTCCQRLVHA